MKEMVSNGIRTSCTMMAFSLVFTALMAGTYSLTNKIVLKNEEEARAQLIAQVLPNGSYNNNLLADARQIPAADSLKLGNNSPAQLYLAKNNGAITAAVLETSAPDGYAGEIKLLVAVNPAGDIQGVRVVAHRETPGLGDYIEAGKSKWIFQFDGKSLMAPPIERWKVKKDGGVFDSTAGATISPRAIVGAVKRSLEYVAANRAAIFGTDTTPPATGVKQ